MESEKVRRTTTVRSPTGTTNEEVLFHLVMLGFQSSLAGASTADSRKDETLARDEFLDLVVHQNANNPPMSPRTHRHHG